MFLSLSSVTCGRESVVFLQSGMHLPLFRVFGDTLFLSRQLFTAEAHRQLDVSCTFPSRIAQGLPAKMPTMRRNHGNHVSSSVEGAAFQMDSKDLEVWVTQSQRKSGHYLRNWEWQLQLIFSQWGWNISTFPFLELSLVATERSMGKFLLGFPNSLLY